MRSFFRKYWRVFNSDLEMFQTSIISPVCFHLNRRENDKCNSPSEEHLRHLKTSIEVLI
jgi:hypothetical protein